MSDVRSARGAVVGGWVRGARGALAGHRGLLAAGSALIASNLAAAGFGFVYWIVAAHFLDDAQVGLASAAVASMSLVGMLTLGGANHVSYRFLPAAGGRQRSLVRRVQAIVLALGLAGGLIYLAGSAVWAPPVAQLGLAFVAAAALQALFNVQDQVLLGLGLPRWIIAKNGGFGVAKLALLIAAGVSAGGVLAGWPAVIWPWLGCLAVATAGVAWLAERRAQHGSASATPLPPVRELVRFGLATHAGGLLLQLPALLYPMLVLQVLGAEATAYFYMAWMIASLLLMAASDVASATVARAAAPGSDVRGALLAGGGYALALTLAGVAGVVLIGRPVLGLFGPTYQEGYPLLLILVAAGPPFAVNTFFAAQMKLRRRLAPLVIQGVVVAVLALGGAGPLGRALGLAGFGLAFTLAHVVVAAGVLAFPLPPAPLSRQSGRGGDGTLSPRPPLPSLGEGGKTLTPTPLPGGEGQESVPPPSPLGRGAGGEGARAGGDGQ